jgi:hypothetical protein
MTVNDIGCLSILRRLTISLQSLSSLCLLLTYESDLEYLNVHIGDAKSINDYTIAPFSPLLNLCEFHFRSDDLTIKFEHLVKLLSYFPNLQSFSLDLTTEDRSFFDGDILQTLVHSFNSFQYSIARFSKPTFGEETLSTFYTSFWLNTKKWLLNVIGILMKIVQIRIIFIFIQFHFHFLILMFINVQMKI